MKYNAIRLINAAITSLCMCASASAQEELPSASLASDATVAVATNPFSQNWEISLGVQGLSFYGNQELNLDLPKSPFKSFRTNVGIAASVAKWFSPEIALRTKLSGFWGRSIRSEEADSNGIRYMSLHEDVLVNLTNIIYGYDEDNVLDVIPYGGVGLARNFTHRRNTLTLHLGLIGACRISDRMKAFCDLSYNIAGGEFDNMGIKTNKIFTNHDSWVALELGLTYELGQNRWKHMVDLDDVEVVPWEETQREMKRIRRQNRDLKEKIDYIEKHPTQEPPGKTVSLTEVPDISIFFELGSSELTHRGQLENIRKLVQTAKDENRRIIVTGYADSQTGNEMLNEKLSARRADTIVRELLNMGISLQNIRIINGGGVNTLDIVPANRRVVVALGDPYGDSSE